MDIVKIEQLIETGNLRQAMKEVQSFEASDNQSRLNKLFLLFKIYYLNDNYYDCIQTGIDLINLNTNSQELNWEFYTMISAAYAMTRDYYSALAAADKANSIMVDLDVRNELCKFHMIHTKIASLIGLERYDEAINELNELNYSEFNQELRIELVSLKCFCLLMMKRCNDVIDICLTTLAQVEGPITDCKSVGGLLLNLGKACIFKNGIQTARRIQSILQKYYHQDYVDDLREILPPFSILYRSKDFEKMIAQQLNQLYP